MTSNKNIKYHNRAIKQVQCIKRRKIEIKNNKTKFVLINKFHF